MPRERGEQRPAGSVPEPQRVVLAPRDKALDLAGVAVSAGAACSSGKVRQSHVLAAMGYGAEAACAIRVSLPWNAGGQDVERFLDAWGGMRGRLRERGL